MNVIHGTHTKPTTASQKVYDKYGADAERDTAYIAKRQLFPEKDRADNACDDNAQRA